MDIYSTTVLRKVVRDLKQPQSFLLDMFFPELVESPTEDIKFDVDEGKRRVAPFVSPLREGRVVKSRGFRTDTFQPAYIKDKRVFDPNRAIRRTIGERIGGELTPAQRVQANLNFEMQDQLGMLTRRLELMAGDVLLDGKAVIEGEDYPAVEVDFARDSTLTEALTLAARWGEANVSPSTDLETWSTRILKKSGAVPTDAVFTPDAWALFKKDPEVKEALDLRRGGSSSFEIGLQVGTGGIYKGDFGNFRLWVYNDWYIDPLDDQEKPILPAYSVILGSAQVEGVRYFGAVRDEEANFEAMTFFPKSWVEKDPAVRILMMQSAPLLVPSRPNASFAASVR
ncbi:major capsid protein [Oceanibacterium hippocampi]|uniref:Phage major capsid protein E n=1 Tax=Oceanibacterium hippocampi TaxID=745714 RepID=A0A1Y5U063_9PROT|nr:major capsid protein [Oceanibacterium hippocampi]SLN77587.1 Phage major capsid protein E [Oceanibacterium hippocampi]